MKVKRWNVFDSYLPCIFLFKFAQYKVICINTPPEFKNDLPDLIATLVMNIALMTN